MSVLGPEGIHSIQPAPLQVLEARQTFYVQAPVARQLDLNDGQVVQATVSVQPDQLHLNVKGQIFSMPRPTNIFAREGDVVQLRAQQPLSVGGDWSLQLMPGVSGQDMAQMAERMLSPTRLRTLLFQPSGFNSWLGLLKSGTLETLVPPGLQHTFQTMQRQRRAYMANLQPQQLKHMMLPQLRSAESRLLRSQPVPVDDGPRTLLRWLINAREDAGMDDDEVTKSLHDALDEVESSQVKASQDWQLRGDINLSLVVPFADNEPVEFQIEREANRQGQPKRPLIINMHTQSPALGEVWLKTTVTTTASEQRQIDLTMWALRPDVASQAMRHSTDLTEEIESAGLVMGGFQVFNAARPDPRAKQDAPAPGRVVDTEV